jgi:voltage-gated potassium channel
MKRKIKKFQFKSLVTWDTVLVIAVFLCAFVIPVFPYSWGKMPVRIGFTLIFVSGVMTMEKRNWVILYLSIAAFIMQWVSGILKWEIISDISRILIVVFFIIVVGSLIREMATAKVVTAKVIMASISGYLLLGIIYSVLIAAIIQQDPDAYNITVDRTRGQDMTAHLSESLYYGFVTLATLGYGDIVPLKPYTRSLATLITISGQLYVATIIGILIGKFASTDHSSHKKDSNP